MDDKLKEKIKYFAYVRKSQDESDRQILSIPAQLEELGNYIKANHLDVVDIIQEEESAFFPGRPKFDAMIKRIEGGEANGLLCWRYHRLSRNPIDAGKLLYLMDTHKLLKAETPQGSYTVYSTDKFMLNLELAMGKKYSDDLSEEVKKGYREKYKRGEYPGSAPVGYLNGLVNGARNIYPDPVRGPLVRRLFEEYATGKYNLRTLVEESTRWGLTTRRNKKISKSHMQHILSSPIYYGEFWHGGSLRQGVYEPLVTKELWLKVQEILSDKGKPKKHTHEHEFSNLLRCGNCGCSIVGHTKIKNYKRTNRAASYIYYCCSHKRGGCKQPAVTEEDLRTQIKDKIQNVTIDEETWKLGIDLLREKHQNEAEKRTMFLDKLEKQAHGIQDKIDRLLDLRIANEIGQEEYAKRKTEYYDQLNLVNQKISEAKSESKNWLELAEDFVNTCYQAKEILEGGTFEEKKATINKIGWDLLLKDKKVDITYRKPYDVLLLPTYRSSWLGS